MAIAGASALVTYASVVGDTTKIVSALVYGAMLIALYVISTLYHSLQGSAKKLFMKLDHMAIYFKIAGTYTPFCLVALKGPWGWTMLITNWILAFFGVFLEIKVARKTRTPSLITYLVMGWLIVLAIKPLIMSLPTISFIFLVIGGLLYSLGVIFFLLDEKYKHFHGIWHLFVMGGSVFQYFSIFLLLS